MSKHFYNDAFMPKKKSDLFTQVYNYVLFFVNDIPIVIDDDDNVYVWRDAPEGVVIGTTVAYEDLTLLRKDAQFSAYDKELIYKKAYIR